MRLSLEKTVVEFMCNFTDKGLDNIIFVSVREIEKLSFKSSLEKNIDNYIFLRYNANVCEKNIEVEI